MPNQKYGTFTELIEDYSNKIPESDMERIIREVAINYRSYKGKTNAETEQKMINAIYHSFEVYLRRN